MRIVMMIFYVCLILLGVSFSVLNAKLVELDLYFKTLAMPMSLLLVTIFAFGVLWGLSFFVFKYLRLKFTLSQLKAQLALSEKEVKNLRSIPIQDQH